MTGRKIIRIEFDPDFYAIKHPKHKVNDVAYNLEQKYGCPCWISTEGMVIPVKFMNNFHLRNAHNTCAKWAEESENPAYLEELFDKIEMLEPEMRRRGFQFKPIDQEAMGERILKLSKTYDEYSLDDIGEEAIIKDQKKKARKYLEERRERLEARWAEQDEDDDPDWMKGHHWDDPNY